MIKLSSILPALIIFCSDLFPGSKIALVSDGLILLKKDFRHVVYIPENKLTGKEYRIKREKLLDLKLGNYIDFIKNIDKKRFYKKTAYKIKINGKAYYLKKLKEFQEEYNSRNFRHSLFVTEEYAVIGITESFSDEMYFRKINGKYVLHDFISDSGKNDYVPVKAARYEGEILVDSSAEYLDPDSLNDRNGFYGLFNSEMKKLDISASDVEPSYVYITDELYKMLSRIDISASKHEEEHFVFFASKINDGINITANEMESGLFKNILDMLDKMGYGKFYLSLLDDVMAKTSKNWRPRLVLMDSATYFNDQSYYHVITDMMGEYFRNLKREYTDILVKYRNLEGDVTLIFQLSGSGRPEKVKILESDMYREEMDELIINEMARLKYRKDFFPELNAGFTIRFSKH